MLMEKAKNDPKVIEINDKMNLPKFVVDRKLYDEIKGYVVFSDETREPMDPQEPDSLKSLISEMEKTQAYRDRLAIIIISAKINGEQLQKLLERGKSFLFVEYSEEMSKCKNAETREAMVTWVFGPVVETASKWKSLKEVAELALSNLDKTYFAIHDIGQNARAIIERRNVKQSF